MAAYQSLGGIAPETTVCSVDCALRVARRALVAKQAANIYDAQDTLCAAVGLEVALRHLVAALDAQNGTP